MPSVSENGCFQDVTDEEYGKVKKGFTYFENGDVLFAKITPCMENGKGAIAEGLTNNIGMGSTEFHVLRPIEEISSPYWLLALTRLPIFRVRASKNMTGTGGQKRVPTNYLENFMVGLPPIEEQNRYENIYKQADKSGFDELKSQFIEMFKDKKTNGKIADLVDTDIKSVKKLFNKDDLIEYIDISSVNAKSRTLNEMTQYIVSSAPSRAQQCVQNGDILVSTVRPINRNVAVVGCDLTNLVASTGFCVLRPKDGYREYLLAIVTSDKYTGKMCDIASGGLYPAVNNGDVLSYDIFIPDKDFLNRITQIYRQADKSGSVLQYMIAC